MPNEFEDSWFIMKIMVVILSIKSYESLIRIFLLNSKYHLNFRSDNIGING